MNKRVVITGVGPVSSIGIGRSDFSAGLARGENNFKQASGFDGTKLEGLRIAEIENFSLQPYLPPKLRKTIKLMSRDVQLAVASSILAMADAAFQIDGTEDRARWGCISGAGIMSVEHADIAPAYQDCVQSGEVSFKRWGDSSIELLPPLMMLKYLPNMLGSHISIIHQLKGISNTITCGEASGHIAIGEAYNAIRRGSADVVLSGGAQSCVNATDLVYEHTRGRISNGQSVPGEGAGYIVLESLDSALQRNVRIYAELRGFSVRQSISEELGSDPSSLGLTRAINAALRAANLNSNDIDTITPSAVGVIDEDAIEHQSLRHIFGSAVPDRLFNTRALLGNCYAGNSLDLIAATLLLAQQPIQSILSTSTSPEGQHAALVLTKFADTSS